MKITIAPASSKAAVATIRLLLTSPPTPSSTPLFVRGIYRNLSKVPEEFKTFENFEAVKGNVAHGSDDEPLDLGNPDAVMYISPYGMSGEDNESLATRAASNLRAAIERCGGAKRVVVQSSFASELEASGLLKVNRIADAMLKDVAPRVYTFKPCTFYDMWIPGLKSIAEGQATSFESYLSPADLAIPMVSINDVAHYCALALLDEEGSVSTETRKIFGPRNVSSNDVRDVIEELTGQKGVQVKCVPREGLKDWWVGLGVGERKAQEFVDFVEVQLEDGEATKQNAGGDDTIRGKWELIDELREALKR